MRFAVVALGSTGDLHPYLAIARELVRRGHSGRLLSQAPYEAQVRSEGVDFVSVVDAETHVRALSHPRLWDPIDGFGVLWRYLAVPAMEPVLNTLECLAKEATTAGDGPLLVFATPLAAGARIARARWPEEIRLVSGYTAPLGLRSTENPMFLGSWQVPSWIPKPLRLMLWEALDRAKLEPMARKAIHGLLARKGILAPTTSLFGDWLHSPDAGVALFPREFAEVPAAWRRRGVIQGAFPLFRPTASPAVTAPLCQFLADHPRFAVIYPGSASSSGSKFETLGVQACKAAGLAVVFLSPHLVEEANLHSDALLRTDPEVHRAIRAPLADILPRSALFVHHGGIGSIAEAWNAGVPQLILASAYDQFENGFRVQSGGYGQWLRLSAANKPDLLRATRDALNLPKAITPDSSMSNHGASFVCELIERFSVSAPSTPS